MTAKSRKVLVLAVVVTTLRAGFAQAAPFRLSESVDGNLDAQLTLATGMRVQSQSPQLVGSRVPGADTAVSSNGDDGDLNYNKYNLFTTSLKITPELLLRFPDGFKFLVRGSALYDFLADETRRTELSNDAKNAVVKDIRLLDLWVSKDFSIGNQRARIRIGNQVISWGESIFAIGGINATSTFDFQKLSVPGTQLKEAILPAPIVSVASGLGGGFNVEAYYQFAWYENRLPPVGTYFSVADILGGGRGMALGRGGTGGQQPLILNGNPSSPDFVNFGGLDPAADPTQANSIPLAFTPEIRAKNAGQFGAAMHYKPPDLRLDLGFYFLNYHDKMPVLSLLADGQLQWKYLENRQLYGLSANFPVGNWAVGTEVSYRPKEAIALSSCFGQGGALDSITNGVVGVDCPMWADEHKFQTHLTGILLLTPGDHGWLLDLLGAQTGSFTGEAVWIYFPGVGPDTRVSRTLGGIAVDQVPAAGYGFWKGPPLPPVDLGLGAGPVAYNSVAGQGTAHSVGYTVDFNWTYDNKIIKGWQVTPGVTFFHAAYGYTPTLTANFFQGAKSLNFYVLFNQNPPAHWQAGINYTNFFGSNQLLADRDFVGAFLTRNF
ncbi:MAG TPA: DUF1302 domain-containing protein [Anaeromyxobacteraceae bacterium]|nr:DUF1302 domain-containing protein [Anaeromyxobacteraceae bacterium]